MLLKKIVKRLSVSLATLIGVVTLVFIAVRVAPGSPADNILGEFATNAQIQKFNHELYLDRTLPEQYLFFLRDIFSGSFGYSYQSAGQKEKVSSLILKVVPATAELALWGILIAVLIAFPAGFLSAIKKNSMIDHVAMFLALLGIAVPIIWLGPVLIYWLCVKNSIFPLPGETIMGSLNLVLPGFVLGTALSGVLTRVFRASLIKTMEEMQLFSAKLRGLNRITIYLHYLIRNSLIPVLTVLGMQFASLLSGAIITEKIFARPGIGTLLLDAISSRDYNLVQGCVLFIAFVYISTNVIVDLLTYLADPRLMHAEKN